MSAAGTEIVIEIEGLTKLYGPVVAVQGLSLQVLRGGVFGLLGPNGSGKTTTMSMLLGLVKPTSGSIRLFGEDVRATHLTALRRIGAIVESPTFYPYLSGRANLRFFQGIGKGDGPEEIDRLLDLVDLSERADSQDQTYSLGMKQRLGIAFTLLGDPDLVFLDESTNGLDPAGVAEVRDLIRRLGAGGRTVVLSSHLLYEVEQVCDRVAILSRGRLIAHGTVRDLLRQQGSIRLKTTDNAEAQRVINSLDWVSGVREKDGHLVAEAPTRAVGRPDQSARSAAGFRYGDGTCPSLAGALLLGYHRRAAQPHAGGDTMMGNVFNLVRWEWFKLQRRRMTWVLLAILLLFSQLAVWGGFFSYNSLQASGGQVILPGATGAPDRGGQFRMVSCNALMADSSAVVPAGTAPQVVAGLLAQCQQQAGRQQDRLQQIYDGFTLPGSLRSALGIAQTIGLVLLAILTASAIGSDYGLGTLRPILVRGMGRVQYLAGKFLVLLGAAAGALLVVSAITAISSVIATALAEVPPGSAVAVTSWVDAGNALSKTWVSFIPYIAMTATATLFTRSAAAGWESVSATSSPKG